MKIGAVVVRFRRSPRVQAWAAVFLAIIILIARKPWAVGTPQLWAEDGTIHLNENDAWGIRALLVPYRGYLHVLPRIVAWFASRTADVAYWPAIYNGAALLFTVLLFARMASPRLKLPGKPWLILSFVLVAHSGEIFLNLTNLHWLTGFFLVQQLLINRPTTTAQRVGDYFFIAAAGLSDPSAIIFLPLFVGRWWRERHRDAASAALVVAACAAVQAYFLLHTPPDFVGPSQPLHLWRLLQTSASRLVIWPFLGPRAVTALRPSVQGVIGTIFIFALLAWGLRTHPQRRLRAWVILSWAAITLACLFRIRPDTWSVPIDNLSFAEPYFYMSRVLLIWLVIWEFASTPRAIAWLARAACVVGVALELPYYRVSTPTNYHWAEHCDPIRRGVPAKIPILPDGWILQYPGRPPQAMRR